MLLIDIPIAIDKNVAIDAPRQYRMLLPYADAIVAFATRVRI
jgi:hypothetical protein